MKKTEEQKRADLIERPFIAGDVIEFCGKYFRVISNSGDYGTVELTEGNPFDGDFYWTFEDYTSELIEAFEEKYILDENEQALFQFLEQYQKEEVCEENQIYDFIEADSKKNDKSYPTSSISKVIFAIVTDREYFTEVHEDSVVGVAAAQISDYVYDDTIKMICTFLGVNDVVAFKEALELSQYRDQEQNFGFQNTELPNLVDQYRKINAGKFLDD